MTREWLITIEGMRYVHAPDDDMDGRREWSTIKYYKVGVSEYMSEIESKESGNTQATVEEIRFRANSDLVQAVLDNVQAQYRVKELPCQYGAYWRELFRKKDIRNWANETPWSNS
jgi:hypothetical protein